MIKEKRYKIEIDPASPAVCVLKDVPYHRLWEFLRAYPKYKKYAVDCNRPIYVHKKCKVGTTALWKLVDALTYSMGSCATNIRRDAKDLKRNYGVNIATDMYKYLTWDTAWCSKKLKMYKLNFLGENLRAKLKHEDYPMEALCKADRKQDRLYNKALEASKKVLYDYNNWDIEKSLAVLK